MKRTKDFNTNKGITLIALVITIIVMLILVAVTISMAVNGGLFDYAGKAASETNNALKAEQQLADGGIKVGDVWYNSIDEYLKTKNGGETISKTESYIGYYADVDADGTVDGVIYADLAIGGEGAYAGYLNYSYEAETGLKDYYVSKTNYEGVFGTKDVLTATGTGKDRFYVMALTEIDGNQNKVYYTWYASKVEDGVEVDTLEEFGTGRANTQAVLEIWNADTDEAKSSNDIWARIQTPVNEGWFLPSIDEWSAFGDVFTMEDDNDLLNGKYGLDSYYYSSTMSDPLGLWVIDFGAPGDDGGMIGENSYICTRLSTTF